jgi:hypothetical protein
VFIIDDLLLAPFTGLQWVAKKIHEAAQEQLTGEADAITGQLQQLYRMLEARQITEAEFDQQERVLLDRLEAAHESAHGSDEEEQDDEDEVEDDAEGAIEGDEPDDEDANGDDEGHGT